eukprot:TRINITY_DN4798_c3_g1_i2.p1 TRINITY_DN4798_c3_g1~~TRINITY_DN4798_c3_g1_i2.p1  ORF type:complete len:519 (+),score=92.60 TRINITY_DN4798_c3_g1_i2:68-1624(+)
MTILQRKVLEEGAAAMPSIDSLDSFFEPTSPSIRELPRVSEQIGDLAGKTVMFILTGSYTRVSAYMMLKNAGVKIIMVHPEKNFAVPAVYRWIHCEVTNIPHMLKMVTHKIQGWKEDGTIDSLDGVLTFDEYGCYPAACLAEHLGLRPSPGPTDVVKKTNVKSAFRQHCIKHGIRSPKFVTIYTPEEIGTLDSMELQFPVVCKPSPGAGSMLVKMLHSLPELKEHAAIAFANLNSSKDIKHWANTGVTVHLQIEEYIGGQEVDVDCIIQEGKICYAAISDNKQTTRPYFCEMGGVAPSKLPESAIADIYEQLERFVKSHGTRLNSALHYEAKYDFDRQASFVIEVNLRIGAAETECLNRTAWGVNLAEQYVRVACGLEAMQCYPPKKQLQVASTNFRPKKAGTLIHQKVPLEVINDESFVGATLYLSEGDRVGLPPESFSALGWLCASGESYEEALANCDRLGDLVVFTVDADTPNEAAFPDVDAGTVSGQSFGRDAASILNDIRSDNRSFADVVDDS